MLTRVVNTGVEIESCLCRFDNVHTEATGEDRSQIQGLQLIGLEIRTAEGKYALGDVVAVTSTSLNCVRGGSWKRQRRIVGGVNAVQIKRSLVMEGFAVTSECKVQVLGLTVTACQRKPGSRSDTPAPAQRRTQCSLIRLLLFITS